MCFGRFGHHWIVIRQNWEYDSSYVPPRRKLVDDLRFCPKCEKLQRHEWGWSDHHIRDFQYDYREILSLVQQAKVQYNIKQNEGYKKYDPRHNI